MPHPIIFSKPHIYKIKTSCSVSIKCCYKYILCQQSQQIVFVLYLKLIQVTLSIFSWICDLCNGDKTKKNGALIMKDENNMVNKLRIDRLRMNYSCATRKWNINTTKNTSYKCSLFWCFFFVIRESSLLTKIDRFMIIYMHYYLFILATFYDPLITSRPFDIRNVTKSVINS